METGQKPWKKPRKPSMETLENFHGKKHGQFVLIVRFSSLFEYILDFFKTGKRPENAWNDKDF